MQIELIWRFLLLLFVGFFVAGCAHTQHQFEYQQVEKNKVWPQTSEKPRYRYLGVIAGEQNFTKVKGSGGVVRRSFDWLGDWVFGEDVPSALHRPQSGVFDSNAQRLYVTDVGRRAVFVFDLAAKTLDLWENADNDKGFLSPVGVCVLDQDKVFVSDADLGFVSQFDATGKFGFKFGEQSLARPTGLACDQNAQRIYVADSQQHRIKVFSAKGALLFEIGERGRVDGKFNSPTHLSFANDKLYVSDTLNARVQVFDADGKWIRTFGKRGMYVGNLPRPKGIAVDSEENIYVIESYYDYLLIFDEQGRPLLPIGSSGSGAGEFYLPAGVWVDATDKIYVADMFNSRVVVFQYIKYSEEQVKH